MPRTYTGLDAESDFGGRFPYQSRRFEAADGVRIAYVDEGPRDAPLTFLLLHGNPTWGFLYRRFIDRLWNRYRVVVPDHAGFGRSDKPTSADYYSLERHIQNLDALTKHLQLRNVVPVLHDWGGPIGMGWAVRNAESVKGFVVLNSWAFVERPNVRLPWLYRRLLLGSSGWRRIVAKNVMTELVLARSGTSTPLEPEVVDAYRAPHPRPGDRIGVARMPLLVPQTQDRVHESWNTMKSIEDALPAFREHPALLVWAQGDVAFGDEFLQRWKEVFPAHAGPILLPNARHYLQEDSPMEVLREIEAFAETLRPSPEPVTPTEAPEPVPVQTPVPPPAAPEPVAVPEPPTPVVAVAEPAAPQPPAEKPTKRAAKPREPGPKRTASHLVQDGDAKDVKRVPKRDPGRVDDQKPRVPKPRVVRR